MPSALFPPLTSLTMTLISLSVPSHCTLPHQKNLPLATSLTTSSRCFPPSPFGMLQNTNNATNFTPLECMALLTHVPPMQSSSASTGNIKLKPMVDSNPFFFYPPIHTCPDQGRVSGLDGLNVLYPLSWIVACAFYFRQAIPFSLTFTSDRCSSTFSQQATLTSLTLFTSCFLCCLATTFYYEIVLYD